MTSAKGTSDTEDWAVVVAELVERLLPIPEVRGSNPVIGKIYIEHLFIFNCVEGTKFRKRGRKWPVFYKKILLTKQAANVSQK